MKNETFSKTKLIMAAALIAFGVIGRMALQGNPNVEVITTASLLAGSLLGGFWTIAVGLIIVAATDMMIGNTNIMSYTWTAWAVMGVFGYALRKREKKPLRHALELTGAGLLANLFFFAWTNFGVWHIGGLYPHTAAGLVDSYIMGLPFLKYQVVGTLLILPAASVAFIALWNRLPVLVDRNASVSEEAADRAHVAQ